MSNRDSLLFPPDSDASLFRRCQAAPTGGNFRVLAGRHPPLIQSTAQRLVTFRNPDPGNVHSGEDCCPLFSVRCLVSRMNARSPSLSCSSGTDAELLSLFVRDGDGAAFSALVERHLKLVFGVACRRTESRELAQEAAQNTFCQLARHAARLRIRESLAPWLHKVSLRESGTLLRAERSRRRAMERLAESMRAPGMPTAAVADSGQPHVRAGEHLDKALASLPEEGRRLLILRYLQGLSLRELAAVESASEEAVRKRITRALDRLTILLARRGVTASALMGCLTHVPPWPAPPPGVISARAAREAAPLGLGTFAGALWPTAVFLAAAIPAALPWKTILPATSGGEHSAAISPSVTAQPDRKPAAPATTDRNLLTPAVMAGLRRDLSSMQSQEYRMRDVTMRRLDRHFGKAVFENSIDPLKWAAIQRLIADLTAREIEASATTLFESPGGSLITETLFQRWAELDQAGALPAAMGHAAGSGPENTAPLKGVVRVMARRDFAGTLRWIKNNAPQSVREHLLSSLMAPLAAQDPRAYLRWMSDPSTTPGPPPDASSASQLSVPDEALCDILPYAPELALEGLRRHELDGALSWPLYPLEDGLVHNGQLAPEQLEAMAAFAGNLPPDSRLRQSLLRIAGTLLADSQPGRAADLMMAARHESARPDREWLGSMGALIRDWQDQDPPGSLAWLAAHGDLGLDPDILSVLVRHNRIQLPAVSKSSSVNSP